MIRLLRFLRAARFARVAYIDMDGTLLYRMRLPSPPPRDSLAWWHANLTVRPVIKSRLLLCYFLKYVLRVELHIWTNRSVQHVDVTKASLGKHMRLFPGIHIFAGGEKDTWILHGPVMDDQAKYVDECGYGQGLLVKQR